jgi:hypothetical protein
VLGVPTSPRAIAGCHAGYLIATGAWPLLHRNSFEAVAGKKQDFWLVRTVGGLAIVTGLSLGVAAARGTRVPETVTSALGSALVFAIADVHAARTQSPVYLGDTVLQLVFASSWLGRW